MPNPMLGQLNTSKLAGLSNRLAPIKNMMAAVRNAGNPSAMMQQFALQNPQMQKAMQMIQQSGGDPKTAFYKLADQMGVNGDDILKMLG